MKSLASLSFLFTSLLLAACSDQSTSVTGDSAEIVDIPVDASTIHIINANVIDGTGNVISGGSVLIEDGLISAVGLVVDAVFPLLEIHL